MTTTYDTGTATFTQSSAVVTGQGVNWVAAGIREGDIFWSDGLSVRVQELVSNTELLLAFPWPGTTRTNIAYEIRYTSDMGRVLSKTMAILEDMETGGNLPLKNLAPAANRFPYYTGATTAALGTITSKGRNIINKANNADVIAELGLEFQTAPYDNSLNRLLRVGAFGLGSTQGTDITNINNVAQPTSICTVTPTSTTGTLPSLVGAKDAVIHVKISTNIAFQIYLSSHATSPMYYRRSTGSSAWQAWQLIPVE